MAESKKTVLLVDDNAELLKVLSLFLERSGFKVLKALSGIEGLQKARQNRPHLIVLDVMMPDLDGFQVLKRLRSVPETRGIPILMLTSLSQKDKVVSALREGADDYIIKTATSSAELCRRIEKLLMSRRDAMAGIENPEDLATGVRVRSRVLPDWELRRSLKEFSAPSAAPAPLAQVAPLLKGSSTLSEWLQLFERRPFLAKKLAALAQSGIWGAPPKSDLPETVVPYIGSTRLKYLSIFLAMVESFPCEADAYLIDQARNWRHAIATASIARGIALHNEWGEASLAATAAALHDVGLLMLHKLLGGAYARLQEEIARSTDPPQEIEQELLGITHGKFAASLFSGWGMPPEVAEVAALQRESWGEIQSGAKHNPLLVGLVQLSCTLALAWSREPYLNAAAIEPSKEMLEALSLREGSIEAGKRALENVCPKFEEVLMAEAREQMPEEAPAEDALAGRKIGVIDESPPAIDPLMLYLNNRNAKPLYIKPADAQKSAVECDALVLRLRSAGELEAMTIILANLASDSPRRIPAVLVVNEKEEEIKASQNTAITAKCVRYPYTLSTVAEILAEEADAEAETAKAAEA